MTRAVNTALAGSGGVLQVVHATTSTLTSTSSASFVSTTNTATITPTSSSSRILILTDNNCFWGSSSGMGLAIYRNATQVYADTTAYGIYITQANTRFRAPFNYLDSPATTSATTYTLYIRSYSGVINLNNDSNPSSITLLEIAG